jgi:hypothetical protein
MVGTQSGEYLSMGQRWSRFSFAWELLVALKSPHTNPAWANIAARRAYKSLAKAPDGKLLFLEALTAVQASAFQQRSWVE